MKKLYFAISAILLLAVGCNLKEKFPSFQQEPVESKLILIPGGEFIMGKEAGTDQQLINNQAHKVYVDSFYIENIEVTNARYFEFCQATNHRLPEFWGMDVFRSSMNYPNHPVTGVTWADAKSYAEWRGLRLPTEAEWEFAARGGLQGMDYPNGNDIDSSLANFYPTQGNPLEVGSYPPNNFGLFDMSGNVTEWVWDFYDRDFYQVSSYKNPKGPVYGEQRCIRGGGWRSGKSCTSVHFRQSLRPYWVDFNVGFRCAKDLE
jgi:formylglycine-generating enzyme required for sulfatase activity